MAKEEFHVDYLKYELGLPYDNDDIVVSDEITDTGRWSIYHSLVFKNPTDGKFYEVEYSVGATEMQPEGPWEYEDIVIATEVKRCKVITEEYLPVDKIVKGDVEKLITDASDTISATLCEYAYNEKAIKRITMDVLSRTFLSGEGKMENEMESSIEEEVEEELEDEGEEECKEEPEEDQLPLPFEDPIPLSSFEIQQPQVNLYSNIDPDKFDKFFNKLKEKLDDIFYRHETTIFELSDTPSPNDSFAVHCVDGEDEVYVLGDLYEKYKRNKENDVSKPLKQVVSEIEEDYDSHSDYEY